MIRKETLDFLNNLKKNNTRVWFAANRTAYDSAFWNIMDMTVFLLDHLQTFDDTLTALEPKDCIFRIFRDLRFAADKSPFKTNFGIFIKRGGRKIPGAGYYLHIEPGSCMLSGGIYMPPPHELAAVRAAIAKNPDRMRQLLSEPKLADEFGHLWGDAVKTAPRGYPKDHPAIDLIRHKHYIVGKEISDSEILDPAFPEACISSFRLVRDFNVYLNSVMTE